MRFIRSVAAILLAAFFAAGCAGQAPVKNDTVAEKAPEIDYLTLALSSMPYNCNTLGDTRFGQELMNRLGVKINFRHYSTNEERYTILASGDLPDIFENEWTTFMGGPQQAIENGYIIKLNDVINHDSPNLRGYLDKHPEIDKMVQTTDGIYYVYPFIRSDKRLLTSTGPVIRKDWLDDLGLEVPETIEEWHRALLLFKEKKGASCAFVPTTVNSLYPFFGAYGVWPAFYQENGRVKHGVLDEKNYKAALENLHSWYKEGIIDPFFILNITDDTMQSYMLSGKSGAFVGLAGYAIGYLLEVSTDNNFNIVPAPYPVLSKGDKAKFAISESYFSPVYGAAVTTQCEDVQAAARVLDYAYGREGSKLFNYGIEQENYIMVKDQERFTDMMYKNPEGLSVRSAMRMYNRSAYGGPFVQEFNAIEQYYYLPQQKMSFDVWANDMEQYNIPPVAISNKRMDFDGLLFNFNSYLTQQQNMFIMGARPISEYDRFVQELEQRGLNEIMEVYAGILK